jgi:hypothetical protein
MAGTSLYMSYNRLQLGQDRVKLYYMRNPTRIQLWMSYVNHTQVLFSNNSNTLFVHKLLLPFFSYSFDHLSYKKISNL